MENGSEKKAWKKAQEEYQVRKKAFVKKLQKDCPKFWRDTGSREYVYALPAVGSGWYKLLHETSVAIEEILAEMEAVLPLEEMPAPTQVKEKFGALRFYWNPIGELPESVYNRIDNLIQEAEQKSCGTCESCGDTKTAKARSRGWIKTLCDNCQGNRK